MQKLGFLLVVGLATLLSVVSSGQEGAPAGRAPGGPGQAGFGDYAQPPEPPPDPAMVRLRNKVNPEFDPWTPAYVYDRCAEHLATVNQQDRCRIRYFDFSGNPRVVLPSGTASIMFGSNSVAFVTQTYAPRPVPHTDNRIFWFDLAWYNWTAETWDNISNEDPYFRVPIIPSNSPALLFLTNETHANPVIRGDWFMWYTFDNGEFINQVGAEVFNENAFYYQLLYSNITFEREVEEEKDGKKAKVKKKVKGVGPKNTRELEAVWGIDFDLLKRFPFDKGFFADQGHSGVAWQNRIAWRINNGNVKYWRTFDVFRTAGDQDFFENPFPQNFNAGEHIIQDGRGAQFYHLSNGKGESQDFANPFVVKGDATGPHHTVLVTGKSCIHCHDTGILTFRNEHLISTRAGVDLLALTPDRAERFRQFYLQEARMTKDVKRDQEDYTDFVRECNGLTPAENLIQFTKFRKWYVQPVTLEQAAREIGTDVPTMADALGNLATKGRLGRMALDGYAIPRHAWERGLFAEAALLLQKWLEVKKIRKQGG